MKLRLFSGLAALALAALLAACTPAAPAEPAPSPGAASPAPTAELPTPVTEEELPALYEAEGYTVVEVRGYLDDFVVEYTYGGSEPRLLDWVFGETGRRVYLTGLDADASYQITGPGEVRFTTGGVSSSTPWKGLPESGTVRVLVDAYGRVPEDAVQTTLDTVETWLDPAEPFYMGWWENGRPDTESTRFEQVYDARIDADGLSFSFIPNGDSKELFGGFFPAATTIPSFETSFDPDRRVFTLRLHNTCLESGGTETDEIEEWIGEGTYPKNLYPYSFPAGSLGRGSHFLRDVTIAEDGEDVVVTAVLTERAYRFTVEVSNLGSDNIPSFRIVFREKNLDLDGRD
ncbi:GH36 C-terminal domain-containing protein [Flavonifractor plautii]|uniref:GH36 C-terminal domain-containing protein n=1 Tax=Flavonifractor plautii TaxID=292800 RepID=UPI00214BDBE8|nr:GH36 C-terminal domain-containing protein [Flavonifractor plautii]MCR1921879.1 GH36 C-terminal domain-containing protein [Flavonifractor plautii]